MDFVNKMLGKSFKIEDYSKNIVVNGFGKRTQEIKMSDVVTMDNVATLSEIAEKNDLAIVWL